MIAQVVKSRYLMNGAPKNCAYCNDPLVGSIVRVGTMFFCDDACVECYHDNVPLEPQRRAN